MAEQTLHVLVAQGEEIINDIVEATRDTKPPQNPLEGG
jgi:hypothetical protein